MSVANQLSLAIEKTTQLIEICDTLQEMNDLLQLENDNLKLALKEAKENQNSLEEKVRILKLAKSIETTTEKTLDIKQKINDFVREIDKCVALLKK